LEQAAIGDWTVLTDQIDELSTRLILDGVASLAPGDFEGLGRAAEELGNIQVEDVARRIAQSIAPGLPVPEHTRLVSAGLEELRRLLDSTPSAVHDDAPPACPTDQAPEPAGTRSAVSANQSLAADEELIREFITESAEHLGTIESHLLILEKDNSATETLNAIFRGFHTIKGLAGFLEFAEIQSLTHEVETLLDLARTSQLAVSPSIVDVVLESTDVVRQELAAITHRLGGKMPPPTQVTPALLERVRQAARGALQLEPFPASTSTTKLGPPQPHPFVPAPIGKVARVEDNPPACPPHEERRISDSSSVRIDTAKLDHLMDMVGEMVIAQTLIQHSAILKSVKDARLERNLAQLARITADVQRITTGMRMVPIGLQFNKSARLVRDLARRAGKEIVFESSGEDTELDKTIAEQLSDPLLHMVRNSIDHGIESAEERIAQGKDPTARIRVSAYHQSGQIVVTVSDDGRGLNREKILAKARQNGLVQPGAQPTDTEIFLQIFEAGFSTAERVTDISGRGVGMDVVRRHVQKLRGRIDIQSKAGEGTTFLIKLPLTLAIIDGLVVVVGQQRYIVPIFSVREMFRPSPEILSTVQETAEMALVRGRLLPIVRLHRSFGIEPSATNLTQGTLIVTESEGRPFCLFVDDLIGKQEVVIKTLGRRFKDVAGIAGCAILGDGRVGLILDIDGIYKGRA
jgi:two-component system, chemotaxis family, sensor kinase CheA